MPRSPQWLIIRASRLLYRRFRHDWARLPRGCGRVWLTTLLLGWVGCALLMLLLAYLGEAWLPPLQEAEKTLLRRLVAASPFAFDYAIFIESPGNGVVLSMVTLNAAILAVWLRRPLHALSILASFVLLVPLVGLGWGVWQRPRPTFIADGVASPSLNAFPSGHASLSLAVYGLLTYLWMAHSSSPTERVLALVTLVLLVGLVGLARLVLGAHWPSDLVGGVVVGGGWLAVLIVALRRATATH